MSSPKQPRIEGAKAPSQRATTGSPSLYDFDGHIYTNIQGLAARFLDGRPWSGHAMKIAEEFSETHGLDDAPRGKFVVWLEHLQAIIRQNDLFGDVATHFTWLEGGSQKSSLVLSPCAGGKGSFSWSNVLALGEMSVNGSYSTGFHTLCIHAKRVFSHQPARVLLHGFYIYGAMLEMWVFDRSGIYGSQPADIITTPSLLTQTLASYLLMDSASLGVADLIKCDDFGKYVDCESDSRALVGRLYLDEPAIFARVDQTIVGDGLTCYRAKLGSSGDCKYAVKIKWSEPGHKSEVDLLRLAMEKHVWGVIHLIQHRTICQTSDWRRGLTLGGSRGFLLEPGAAGRPGSTVNPAVKIPRSETLPTGDTGQPCDRVFDCIITEPLGESLHRFESIAELLYALRDAVKAHRSLYLVGGILHRDISPGNIIIPSRTVVSGDNDSPKGLLIDLDNAELAKTPSKQFESVGTPLFQAIGVLQAYLPDNPHTYRHDLESFFYCFVFLAICKRPVPLGENQLQLPETSALNMWTEGRPVDRARRKTKDMHGEDFRAIMAEFTPEFRGLQRLAEKLRCLLFPMRLEKLWTGTDHSIQEITALYNGMIEAFDIAAQFEARRECQK